MASYVETFKSKLDWAMPFQRTGDFPIDRTDLFSSYDDIIAYAKKDGSDTRKLGGTAFVGQLVINYGPGPSTPPVEGEGDPTPGKDEVAAYVITAVGASPSVMKLAQSSSTGDYATDIANLQAAVSAIQEDIVEINGKLVVATTTTDGLMAAADKVKLNGIAAGAQANVIEAVQLNGSDLEIVAKKVNIDLSNYATKQDLTAIPKFAIAVVEELPTQDISETTVYLKLQEGAAAAGQDKYDEFIYVNDAWECLGNLDVDLSQYSTTAQMNEAIAAAVAGLASQTWVTEQLGKYTTTENLTALLAAKADKTTVSALDTKVTGIDGRVTAVEGKADTNASDIAAIKTDLTDNYVKKTDKIANAANADTASKVAHALTFGGETYDGSAAKEITAESIGALTEDDIGTMTVKVGEVTVGTTDGGASATVNIQGSGSNVHVSGDTSGNVTIAVDAVVDTVRPIQVNQVSVLDANTKTALNFTNDDMIKARNEGASVSFYLGDGTVTGTKLKSNTVVTDKLADNAITTAKIGAGQVTDEKVATMNATKLFLNEGDTLIFDCGTEVEA